MSTVEVLVGGTGACSADEDVVVCCLGHLQTTATWNPDTRQFIINSPTTLSQKYWITNSAVHAQWAVVFAQLLIRGQNQGIHGFLVRWVDTMLGPWSETVLGCSAGAGFRKLCQGGGSIRDTTQPTGLYCTSHC